MAEEIKSAQTNLNADETVTSNNNTQSYESEVKKQQQGVTEIAEGNDKKELDEFEFTDTSEKEEPETAPKKEEKQKQTKEQNSEFAKRRREEERKAELDKTRIETIIEVLNGKNPYTNEEMTDKEDVEDYLAMKEIEKQGGDPIKDYFKFRKTQRKEVEKNKSSEEQRKEWFTKDREDFITKHPEVNLNDLIDNKQFAVFAKGKVGNIPMSEIYDDYLGFIGETSKKADSKAIQMLANSEATPGALKTSNTTEQEGFFTREQVEKMSQKEVNKHYDAIRNSMKKWNY